MGKVLIASFDREEEQDFEELVLFLKEKGYRDFTGMASADNVLKYNDLKINPKYRTVRKQGEDIKLMNYEFDILYLLAKKPGQVFSKEQIYSQVWKEPYYGAEDNVMSLIRRIRKKIEPDPSHPIYILTVWGIGHRFSPHMDRK
jgi:DNA-binding response OmpR family regulator